MKNNAYIIAGFRSAVGKANKGGFRFYRPDDLAADVIKHLLNSVPQLDKTRIDDVIVGNATPEAEQGLNVGRLISLMGLNTDSVGNDRQPLLLFGIGNHGNCSSENRKWFS